MIWESELLMELIDVVIIAAALTVVFVFNRHRDAIGALQLQASVAWIIAGMLILALFYAGDLVVIFLPQILISPAGAMAAKAVRRHINWNKSRPDLREDLAHLVQDVMRRVCGIASAGSPWFLV